MRNKKREVTASAMIAVLFIYLGLAAASCTDSEGNLGLYQILRNITPVLNHPSQIRLTGYTLYGLIFGALTGLFFGAYYYFTRKNWMFGIEQGSAKWGDAGEITKKLTKLPEGMKAEDAPCVRILSQRMRMNMSDRITELNNNILLVAGPGKGKTFRIIGPNILCCNGSIMVTDPKKELLRIYGNYLKENGYEIRVIDLIDFDLSDGYNPFCHIRDRADIPDFISLLWSSMEDVKAQKGDPVWDDSAKALIEGLTYYMFYEMEPERRTFRTLTRLLTDLSASEKGIKNMTHTMLALLQNEPAHPAAVKYLQAMNGAENTVRSVMFSATAKMAKISDEKLLRIFDHDTIDFDAMGMGYPDAPDRKTALFFCISDGDTRWNFVVSIAIMQAFRELYYAADHYCGEYNGKLPIPVSCWLDEFRNVPLPDTFPVLLSTMRGRNISSIITIQDPSQLEGLYDKENRTVRGDCDVTIYMGGNEHETHKWISEMLGKMTIVKRSYGKSYGQHGSDSKNEDVIARDLKTPDEVRRMPNKYQIIFVAGCDPVMDEKYATQDDPRFAEAKRLGSYIHIPNREEKKKLERTEKKKKETISFRPLSREEAELMKKQGVPVTSFVKREKEVMAAGTAKTVDDPFDLSEMEKADLLTPEQKAFLISLIAEQKVSARELAEMFTGENTLEQMKTIMEVWNRA